jgi:hypothetical protein
MKSDSFSKKKSTVIYINFACFFKYSKSRYMYIFKNMSIASIFMQIFKTYKIDSQRNNKGIVQYVHQLIWDWPNNTFRNNTVWTI